MNKLMNYVLLVLSVVVATAVPRAVHVRLVKVSTAIILLLLLLLLLFLLILIAMIPVVMHGSLLLSSS